MIHILIGTRAQLIKMIPIMKNLQDRNVEYNFIFMAQHRETILEILFEFGIKEPDYVLCDDNRDIVSSIQMVAWSIKVLLVGIYNKRELFRGDKGGIVMIHGDAPPLLLGAILAKSQKLRVASVEAGLRSFNLLKPFPEEITRVVTAKLGLIDVFYCQDQLSAENVSKYNKQVVNTNGNTIVDTIQLASSINKLSTNSISDKQERYATVSLHRFETISNISGLKKIVELIEKLTNVIQVKFILHPPTREALKKNGLYRTLENNINLDLIPRMTFLNFNKLISKSEFMVTDGGSNQEECAFLGIPCLVIRNETERKDGLGDNAVLSYFDYNVIDSFIENYSEYRRPSKVLKRSPSEIIIDNVIKSL
ncbi:MULTISPECIES: UDP-N-acetylglucosamine 2-epimerase [unclassified Vibrio]|uniref:UDP-N-acetylglucosamine 2-epimerase n=1 Tax=unclassified Vibrio TaxID=2614977 RepID=UPI00354DCB78